jgi:hypothetical protein
LDAQFICGNIQNEELMLQLMKQSSVIFLFMTPSANNYLCPLLEQRLVMEKNLSNDSLVALTSESTDQDCKRFESNSLSTSNNYQSKGLHKPLRIVSAMFELKHLSKYLAKVHQFGQPCRSELDENVVNHFNVQSSELSASSQPYSSAIASQKSISSLNSHQNAAETNNYKRTYTNQRSDCSIDSDIDRAQVNSLHQVNEVGFEENQIIQCNSHASHTNTDHDTGSITNRLYIYSV